MTKIRIGLVIFIIILCILVLRNAWHGFLENGEHNGDAAFIISCLNLLLTSSSLILGLLFVNTNIPPNQLI